MKKIIVVLFLLIALSVTAKAETYDEIIDESGFDDLYKAFGDISGNEYASAEDYISSLSGGDDIFINALKKAVTSAFPDVLRELSLLISVILLSAVLKAAGEALHKGSGTIFNFANAIVTTLILFEFTKSVFTVCRTALLSINTFMQTMLGVMCCFWGFGGNFVYGAKSAATLSIILQATEFIQSNILIPMLYLCFGLTFIGAVSEFKFGAVIKLGKKAVTALCTVLMTVLSIILCYQGILGKTADSLIKRGVQFGASTFIPIVGSAVSESMDAVSGSIRTIKNLSGVSGILILALIIAPPILIIVLNKLFLSIGKMLCDILSLDKNASIISNVNELLSILLAIMLSCGLILILSCGIFMLSLNF